MKPLPDFYITGLLMDNPQVRNFSLNLARQVVTAYRCAARQGWVLYDAQGNSFRLSDEANPKIEPYLAEHYIEIDGTQVNPAAVLLGLWSYQGFWIQTVAGKELHFKDEGRRPLDALIKAGLLQISESAAVNLDRTVLYDPANGDVVFNDAHEALRRCPVLVDPNFRDTVARALLPIKGWMIRGDGALVNTNAWEGGATAASLQDPLILKQVAFSQSAT